MLETLTTITTARARQATVSDREIVVTPSCITRIVHIPAYGASLTAELASPPSPLGLVVFADCASTPSTHSGDREIVCRLEHAGFATLRLDLLTPGEELIEAATRGIANDGVLLARRLMQTIEWAALEPSLEGLPVGLFTAGHATTAAFVATVAQHVPISAIVSLAGRTSRSGRVLEHSKAPALLIVAGSDLESVKENEIAFGRLKAPKEMILVESPAHRFEEPGVIEQISRHAVGWFEQYLSPSTCD